MSIKWGWVGFYPDGGVAYRTLSATEDQAWEELYERVPYGDSLLDIEGLIAKGWAVRRCRLIPEKQAGHPEG